MNLFQKPVLDGTPGIYYKEAIKTAYELTFVFPIENFIRFILTEICVSFISYNNDSYPYAHFPLFVKVQSVSSQNEIMPYPVAPCLFSSPSGRDEYLEYSGGKLVNTEQVPQRLNPIRFNYPCAAGDIIKVSVTGVDTHTYPWGDISLFQCMLVGRKYEV